MMLSLSEILEEALRSSSACQPEPPPLVAWTDDEIAFHYNWLSARNLAARMADCFGIDFHLAWRELGYVPNALLSLLASTAGWTVLADHVARYLGITDPPVFTPTVH